MQSIAQMRREPDEIGEAIRRGGEIGRWRNQDRAIGLESVVQRDRGRGAAHRMPDDGGRAAEVTSDCADAARELGQRRRSPELRPWPG